MKPIDKLYLPEHFFIRLASHLLNFHYADLPKDVHLTFYFGDEGNRYNFRVSRNIGRPDDKPQIVILKIDKQLMKGITERLGQNLFSSY